MKIQFAAYVLKANKHQYQISVTSGSFHVGQGSEVVHTTGPVHKDNLGWEVIRVTVSSVYMSLDSGEDDSLGKSGVDSGSRLGHVIARPVVTVVIDTECNKSNKFCGL